MAKRPRLWLGQIEPQSSPLWSHGDSDAEPQGEKDIGPRLISRNNGLNLIGGIDIKHLLMIGPFTHKMVGVIWDGYKG